MMEVEEFENLRACPSLNCLLNPNLMNWPAYLSLIALSASLLGNALAFQRAARDWANILSAGLGIVPSDPTFPGMVFLPGPIQHTLVPPCVFAWFWLGLLSAVGSLVAGVICLGWQAAIVGIIAAWIVARTARGAWPQTQSRMYSGAFYECLEWRLTYRKEQGDLEGAHWLATLIAAMEQFMEKHRTSG